ncbi:MAG: (S)-ureidoglycine aminohydrolase, partial [Verrucomicrobiota bacterium]
MNLFGQTRTVVASRHALIAPDGHVPSDFPGWENVTAFVLISPALGANLTQLLLTFLGKDSVASFPSDEHEHVLFVESGSCVASLEGDTRDLAAGAFLFVPPQMGIQLQSAEESRVHVFRKVYEPHPDHAAPAPCQGAVSEVQGEPFLGHEEARLQTLLPLDPAFDLAMNIFTYDPGATLPFVETHVME